MRKGTKRLAALVLALAMLLGLAGCSAAPAATTAAPATTAAETQAEAPTEAKETQPEAAETTIAETQAEETTAAAADAEEVTVDIAIVGAGASGTTAACAAIDGGAQVLMVEATGDVGGISKMFAGGPFAVESELMQQAGGEYAAITHEEVIQTLIDYAHFINYGPLVKAIVEKSGDTISWLEKWGLSFHVNPDTPQVAHRDDNLKGMMYHWYDTFTYDHSDPEKLEAMDLLHASLKEAGLDLRFKTVCTELLQDADGVVNGIVATKEDGSQLIVHAKAVILATGGYGGNQELMQEFYNTPNISMWGVDGSGVQMAWDAGAAKWDVASSLFHGNGMAVPSSVSNTGFGRITASPLFWVDQSGNRFCNEEAVWDTAYATNVAYGVGGKFYIVVDTATLNTYSEDVNPPIQMDTAVGGPNMDPADFVEQAEIGVSEGAIIKGETIEELAQALGMEPERLAKNVAEYNEAVATGEDVYGKSKESLVFSVEEGPFYAIPMTMGNLGTLGGVRVNERLQACDVNLKPVPGLYVVGNCAAGFYGNTTCYPPYEGLATGFALNSGRIGGESAAEDIKK